jgi:predicted TIM-barrel fold metal-dependent hydrolase
VCFDALVHTRHLPYLIEAIQPVPDLVVVIDHLAKPDYSNIDETWTRGLRELARRENTFVKISVMATEVSGSAHAYRFRDYVEFVLDTFGPHAAWPAATGPSQPWHWNSPDPASCSMSSPIRFHQLNTAKCGA